MRHDRSLLAACAVLAALVLPACSSFSIVQPADGSTFRQPPAPVSVVVRGRPSMTGLRVSVDGTDVSGQLTPASDSESRGTLTLGPGRHMIAAAADVDCWYCSPNPTALSGQAIVCGATATTTATPSKTPLARADGRTWRKTSDTMVGIGADDGSLATRWAFSAPGLAQLGIIRSVENDCLCLKSVDAAQETPIGLAICDIGDALQQWQAIRPVNSAAFRLQNNGRGISDACLTEGANNVLVQRACNDTPEQLWSVRDNLTGATGSPF